MVLLFSEILFFRGLDVLPMYASPQGHLSMYYITLLVLHEMIPLIANTFPVCVIECIGFMSEVTLLTVTTFGGIGGGLGGQSGLTNMFLRFGGLLKTTRGWMSRCHLSAGSVAITCQCFLSCIYALYAVKLRNRETFFLKRRMIRLSM